MIGHDPRRPLALGLPTVPPPSRRVASVISGHDNHPVLAERLPLLHGRPDAPHLRVGLLHRVVEALAVAVGVPHIVGVLQIHPRELGPHRGDVRGGLACSRVHRWQGCTPTAVVRVGDGVQLEAIDDVVNRETRPPRDGPTR
jgi:hypothetical protein